MYNGIGLKTARGSGTNGFVQRNLSYVRPSRVLQFAQREEPKIIEPKLRNKDNALLEHQAKRDIECALLDLQEKMEEQGYEKEEIDKRIQMEREARMAKLKQDVDILVKKKERQMEGIDEELHDYGNEELRKVFMENPKKEGDRSRSRSRHHHRDRSRSRSEDSKSKHRHHRHHHHD